MRETRGLFTIHAKPRVCKRKLQTMESGAAHEKPVHGTSMNNKGICAPEKASSRHKIHISVCVCVLNYIESKSRDSERARERGQTRDQTRRTAVELGAGISVGQTFIKLLQQFR